MYGPLAYTGAAPAVYLIVGLVLLIVGGISKAVSKRRSKRRSK